ncbi:MAG: hypothetical protein AAF745_17980 [Planctomycetota bacterium]
MCRIVQSMLFLEVIGRLLGEVSIALEAWLSVQAQIQMKIGL